MKAIVQNRYGQAHVLTVAETDRPVPAAGEVLVRVRAASVNRADWHLMTGEPTVMRLGTGLRRPRSAVRGVGCCGHDRADRPGGD